MQKFIEQYRALAPLYRKQARAEIIKACGWSKDSACTFYNRAHGRREITFLEAKEITKIFKKYNQFK